MIRKAVKNIKMSSEGKGPHGRTQNSLPFWISKSISGSLEKGDSIKYK
jgi:hypothetical protein